MVEIGDSFKFDGKDSLGHSKGQWNVRQLTARLVKQVSREKKSQMLAGVRQCAVAARPSIARGGRPVESSDSTVNGCLLTGSWCPTSWGKL